MDSVIFSSDAFDQARIPVILIHFSGVMAGLLPAIHVFLADGLQE
jgi:hypothetical protein